MRFTLSGRLRGLVILAAIALLLWAAYELLWPTYSWDNYIDPDEVRLAAIPDGRNRYEVYHSQPRRLLRRLVAAINRGRRRFPQIKLGVGQPIVLHLRGGRSLLILYEQMRANGPMAFRDATHGYYAGRTLYVSRALGEALRAIRACKTCLAKRPKVATESVSRIVVSSAGSHGTLAGSDLQAAHLLNTLNDFLSSIDTSFYRLPNDETFRAFYMGEVNPLTHCTGTTGALLTLNPPLSMHTNTMFWERQSGPRAEYHEFKTDMILISDALAMKDSYSPEPRRVVGFSSDEKANRFYLFDSDVPRTPEAASTIAEKWNTIIRAIEEAVTQASAPAR